MKELYNKNRCRTGLKMDGLTYDDRSQAVILNKGVPIVSKVNNEEMGIYNNQRFKVIKFDSWTITIGDDSKQTKKIMHSDFQKYFLVAYATTIHCNQGASIGEPYTIHEWERLDQRLT
jgi:hypothetical protein